MLANLEAHLLRKTAEHGVTMPVWIPIVAALGMIALTVAATAQRNLIVPPEPPVVAAIVIMTVAVGWVLSPVWIPWWVDLLTILPSVAWLLATPPAFGETVDAAPVILLLLAAVTTSIGGLRQGAITAALAIPTALVAGRPEPVEVPYFVGMILFGMVMGLMMHWQMRALQAEKEARQEEHQRAALAERQRIAREIHDLVAHSLSVTMLQVTGARRALTEDADIPDAIDALTDAERIGRQAMTDIRRTVGLLTTEPATTLALPGAEDLEALVDEVRSAGMTVQWRTSGDASAVAPTAGLALYRVLQESLANIARHAPGAPADAELTISRRKATLVVTNPVPVGVRVHRGGNGLSGMTSRADQLGGTLTSGPDGRTWRVELRLPLAGDDSGSHEERKSLWQHIKAAPGMDYCPLVKRQNP